MYVNDFKGKQLMISDVTDPDRTITYWEDIANTKWGAYISSIEKKVIMKAHYLVDKPSTALEIGCEGGRWSRLLSELGWKMICTDIDKESLELCKKRIPSANCVHVTPQDTRLPCDAESVKMLLCVEVFPVIQANWFTDETVRVLLPGGLLIGVFLNRLSIRGVYVRQFKKNVDNYKLIYTVWKKQLSQKNMEIIHDEGLCWFPFSRNSNSKYIDYLSDVEGKFGLKRLTVLSPWIVFIARKK